MSHLFSKKSPTARAVGLALWLGCALVAVPAAHAAGAKALPPADAASEPHDPNEPGDNKPPVHNSDLRGPLMYQLLLAELARQENQPADAVELYLEAARHEKNDQLFLRAVEIANEAGAPDKAIDITKAWRATMPQSTLAVQAQLQLLFGLDRVPETVEPLRTLLAMSPAATRSALIATLPRAATHVKDKTALVAQFQALLAPYMDAPETRVSARVAMARLRLADGHPAEALALDREAGALEPAALGPALLALDLMTQPGAQPYTGKPDDPSAEAIVRRYLDTPAPEPIVRQALAALLTQQQRIGEAAVQVRLAAEARPQQALLWLSLGELEIELRHADAADAALHKALELVVPPEATKAAAAASAPASGAKVAAKPAAAATAAAKADDDDDEADAEDGKASPDTVNRARPARIYLMLARSAQLRHDDKASSAWLEKIPAAESDLPVVSLRADLLARAGKLKEARALIEAAPTDSDEGRRLKVLTEVQLLREHKQLGEAQKVLARANAAQPGDVDLLYEQAMIDERLDKLDEMEKLLRQVLTLQPDHAQAMNALGYSLADRRLRLDEALQLVSRAHELQPADPFITDSLGWIEFRMGHLGEATRWLRQAYTARNDTEIAAHLGEALWAQGQKDEALRIFQEARARDAENEVLRETMHRLRAVP